MTGQDLHRLSVSRMLIERAVNTLRLVLPCVGPEEARLVAGLLHAEDALSNLRDAERVAAYNAGAEAQS